MADFQMKTVDGVDVQRAASPDAPRGNIGVSRFLGRARIGQAVSQAGQALGQFAERERRARESATLAQARLEALEGQEADQAELEAAMFDADLETELDESAFAELAAETIGRRKEAMLDQGGLSRDAERELDEFSEEFEQRAMTQAMTAYRKTRAQRLSAKFVAAADAQYKRGDVDAGDAELDRMVEAGLEFPEIVDERKKRGRNFAHVELAKKDLLEDPFETLEFLKEGGYNQLDGSQRAMLTREAETRVNRERADKQRDYALRIDEGELISSDEIDRDVSAGLLLPSHGKALKKLVKGMDGEEMVGTLVEIDREIGDYDAALDPDRSKYYKLESMIYALPEERRSRMLSKLDDRTKAGKASRSVASDGYSFVNGLLDSGRLGELEIDAEGRMVPSMESSKLAMEMRDEVDEYLRENPTAGRADVISHVMSRRSFKVQVRDRESRAKAYGF